MVQKNHRKKTVKQMWQDNKEETGSDGYIHYLDCVTGIHLCQNPIKYHFKYVQCIYNYLKMKFKEKLLSAKIQNNLIHLPAALYFDDTQNTKMIMPNVCNDYIICFFL